MALLALTVMRLLPLALVVLVLSGCASLQRPDVARSPATLEEVNRSLDGRQAMVYFDGDRMPTRTYVYVGPEETVLRFSGPVVTKNGTQVAEHVVPTEEVQRIEVDASLSRGQGAGRGALYGASPGGGIALLGAGWATFCVEYDCIGAAIFVGGGVALAAIGAGLGAGVGSISAGSVDMVTVYQAPITRYPDAALALLNAEPSTPTAR